MKNKLFLIFAMLCAVLLSGCQCKHVWEEANCTTPKTCGKCGETEGLPSEHVAGILDRKYDFINCEIREEIGCVVCGVHLQSEKHHIDSLIKDNLFLFTPEEFCERFLEIGREYYDDFSYEFANYSGVLQALFRFDGDCEAIVSFYYPDASFLPVEAVDAKGIWCVSLGGIDEQTPCNEAFFRACDPTLDEDSAYSNTFLFMAAIGNAMEDEEEFAYVRQNGLYYQIYVPTGDGLYSYSVHAPQPF